MKSQILLFFLLFHQLSAQQILVSGYITDNKNGEALAGVIVNDGKNGVFSNKFGYFSIKTQSEIRLQFSIIGYETQSILLNKKDTVLHIKLDEKSYDLGEVQVSAQKEQSKELSIGVTNISIEKIKEIPMLFGEPDIIKALAMTPGVSIGNEGTTGFLVRGGTPDQNLILLDEAPVYNLAHLFGFISVFNADAIKKVDLYKAYFPPKFGGRLSSILDITMKEGNNRKKNHEVSIGMLGSKILLEGPIFKQNPEKGSFMLSARTSYFSLFLLPSKISFKNKNSDQYFNYWLYDLSAKINYSISEKDKIFVGFYTGKDIWSAISGSPTAKYGFGLNWGNLTFSSRYTRILSQKLFFNAQILHTNYKHQFNTKENIESNDIGKDAFFNTSSFINDFTGKMNFDFYPSPQHEINFGIDLTHHIYTPTFINSSYNISADSLMKINSKVLANELAIYFNEQFSFKNFLKFNAGFRGVSYLVSGKQFNRFEPRLGLNLNLINDFTLKFGYSKMNQFIHQLSSNTAGLPVDIWVPATETAIPPQSDQISFGIFKNIKSKSIETSLEFYQKKYKNLIDYQTGSSFFSNIGKQWENTVERNGIGKSYGIEYFINQNSERFSWWLAYTWAWNKRKFETINNNQWYFAQFDRRHNISVTSTYKSENNKFSMSGNWVFYTGSPITVPVALSRQIRGGEFVESPQLIYTERNNFRVPNYHRLDLSFSFKGTTRKHKDKTWTFGFYNAYNRTNPFYLDLKPYNQSAKVVGYQLVKVGVIPVLPYFNYSVKW